LIINIVSFFTATNLFSQSWIYQTSAVTEPMRAIYAVNSDTVYIVGDNGSAQKTINGGQYWFALNTGITENLTDVAFIDADTGYAVGYSGTIIKTINGGNTWNTLNSGTLHDLNSLFINSLDNVWAVGDNGTILSSSTFGNTWNLIDTMTNHNLNDIAFSNLDTGYITGNNGTLLKTTNGGNNWYNFFSISNYSFCSMSFVSNYIITTDSITIYKIKDSTIYEVIYPGWEPILDLYFVNDSIGYAVGSDVLVGGGWIYKTIDGGYNWEQIKNELDEFYNTVTFINNDTGFVIGDWTIIKTTNGGDLVNVENIENTKIKFYPNPCNEFFIIESNITNIKSFYLNIYNLLGKKQFYTIMKSGQNKLFIDIMTLSTGLYLYELFIDDSLIKSGKILKTDY